MKFTPNTVEIVYPIKKGLKIAPQILISLYIILYLENMHQ